ncbi:MAG: type II toxin-antitoxin system HicA family toxin [Blastocatellia bacterium]|nr:type II toxin-antitoxin system HicA family toxin [Blastocatellia bacterium]
MPKMPIITAKLLIEFLHHQGFIQVRQKGSHKFFRHPDGRTAVVPDHKGEDLGRGITTKILNDVEVTRDEFLNWCRNH